MQEANTIAVENMKKCERGGQRNYNQCTWSSALVPGDHILVRNLTPRGGPGKMRSYWEDMIYVIRGRKGPDPKSSVYVVKPRQETGRERVLHHKLLLPCPYLVEEPGVSNSNLTKKDSGNKAKQTARRNQKAGCDIYLTDTCSSSEEEYHMWTAARPADPPLNAEAREFCPRMEALRERSGEALLPEEDPEEEVEEGHCMEESSGGSVV